MFINKILVSIITLIQKLILKFLIANLTKIFLILLIISFFASFFYKKLIPLCLLLSAACIFLCFLLLFI